MTSKYFRYYMNWAKFYLDVNDMENARYCLIKAYKALGWIA